MASEPLPEITCFADFDDDRRISVYLLHGDRDRGIGYHAGDAVVISGGHIQPGTRMSEKWLWGDGAGRYFSVDSRGIWRDITPGYSPDNGWKRY